MHPRIVGLPLLAALSLGLLVGCGGSSKTDSSSTVPASPAATSTQGTSRVDAVAFVSGTPISKLSYRHWLSVEQSLHAVGSPSHLALGFLITSEWMLGEASARGITVSESEVKRRLSELEHKSFPKSGSLQKFLTKAHETEADLLSRLKVELLADRIAANISAGKSQAQRSALLTAFQKNFQKHWKALTSCEPDYVMEDCKQYKGAPEVGVAPGTSSAPSTSSHGQSSSGSGSSGKSGSNGSSANQNTSGEVYSSPGAFSISSSAFERNGEIPTQYTCAGAGISPPLTWEKVPAHAAELVLFVIDDNSDASNGGIRWIVGGIDPSSTGVAEGKVPSGGIVGTNSAGKAAYGPICPDHGKSDTIEFVMYALSKTIPLSAGFQPSLAEAEYGGGKLILGQAAVTYGVASR